MKIRIGEVKITEQLWSDELFMVEFRKQFKILYSHFDVIAGYFITICYSEHFEESEETHNYMPLFTINHIENITFVRADKV